MTDSRLILFDCDGTLVDSHRHITAVMQHAFADCGLPVPDDAKIAGVIGLSLDTAMAQILPDTGITTRRKISNTYRKLYRDMPSEHGLHVGVRSTLITLQKRGYGLGIVTGKSLPGLRRVLDEFDLSRFFMVWRTADQCPSKPHPGMVNECMAEMGVERAQTAVVGDACVDMQMATACGVRAIGVSFGAGSHDALMGAGAEGVVDCFDELRVRFPPLRQSVTSSTIAP
ncbi:MAG: HAD-IIIA family hydrolase [Mariprofundaceae bacterium]|nr:HAD-IIIA family hydrolase [Mariprofundaceae bacterium]